MNTKVITNNRPILLGKCGENEATLIKFPINVFFPFVNATSFSLVHQRHGDVAPYPCEISQGDGFINWSIKSADVANQGNGVAQLTAYNEEGLVAKTVAFTTVVTDSLGYVAPPEPQQAWVDQVVGYANQAHLAATQASESAAAIQNLGVLAETGSPVAVRKVIDPDTGAVTLVFTIPNPRSITVDYAISKYSSNPVQNRAIARALPLMVNFAEEISIDESATGVVEGGEVTVRDATVAEIFDAMQDGRQVSAAVNLNIGYFGLNYVILQSRQVSDGEGYYVEFYGEIPPAGNKVRPRGWIVLKADAPSDERTFTVLWQINPDRNK